MTRAVLLLALLAPLSLAQTNARPGPPAGWSAGVLGMSVSSPYAGADDDLLAVPVVQYEGRRAWFRGLRLGYRLHDQPHWSFAMIAQPRLLHLDPKDLAAGSNIRPRKRSADLGIAIERRLGRTRAELVAVTDALGRSNGQEVTGRLSLPLRFGPLLVSSDVGLRFWSDELSRYYAGVSPDEAGAGAQAYDPGAAIMPEVGVNARIPLSGGIMLSAQLRYRSLPGELTRSPLIADDHERAAFIGITYRLRPAESSAGNRSAER